MAKKKSKKKKPNFTVLIILILFVVLVGGGFLFTRQTTFGECGSMGVLSIDTINLVKSAKLDKEVIRVTAVINENALCFFYCFK